MLPTYEEALAITEASEAFYIQRGEVSGFEYAMFNYRLATCEDFKEHNAYELRGLTFIKDGEKWVRYPMLTKFFNLNQCECTQYGSVKDKDIVSVENKEDGSLISLILLPNGRIKAKTKMSFDNEQTKIVETILITRKVRSTIEKYSEFTFLFELVSPRNKIVLPYHVTELRLLQVRETLTGVYRDDLVEEFAKKMEVKHAEKFQHTLDELIKMREVIEDIEGWVVKFRDGQMIKIKTEWYIAAHGLMEDISQEHKIIEMILNETIDDVLGELDEGSEEKLRIEEIIELIDGYFNHRVNEVIAMRDKYFTEFGEDRKAFAMKFSKEKDFGVVMKNLKDADGIENSVKERILQETLRLEKARNLIDTLKG
jgi:RNA ligase